MSLTWSYLIYYIFVCVFTYIFIIKYKPDIIYKIKTWKKNFCAPLYAKYNKCQVLLLSFIEQLNVADTIHIHILILTMIHFKLCNLHFKDNKTSENSYLLKTECLVNGRPWIVNYMYLSPNSNFLPVSLNKFFLNKLDLRTCNFGYLFTENVTF